MQNPSCVHFLGQGKKGRLPLPKLLYIKERNVSAQNVSLTTHLLVSSIVKLQTKCMPYDVLQHRLSVDKTESQDRPTVQDSETRILFLLCYTVSCCLLVSYCNKAPVRCLITAQWYTTWYLLSLGADIQKSRCPTSLLNHHRVSIPQALQGPRSKQPVAGCPTLC